MSVRITKEYLDETRELRETLQELQEQIVEWKDKATSIVATITTDVRVQTSGHKDRVGHSVVAYVALEERYDRLACEYTDRTTIINRAIKELTLKQQMVMIDYYLLGCEISEIARKHHICIRQAYREKSNAIKELSKIKIA